MVSPLLILMNMICFNQHNEVSFLLLKAKLMANTPLYEVFLKLKYSSSGDENFI